MAVRQVVKRLELELDPRKEFKGCFPHSLLADESTDERQRICRSWAPFVESVNELCKTRRNIMVNKYMRRAVFDSGMTNLCRGFSQRHLNLKVEFKNREHTSYKLEIVRLSNVPDASLNCRGCVAEVPQLLVETDAELIGEEETPFTRTNEPVVAVASEDDSSTRTIQSQVHYWPRWQTEQQRAHISSANTAVRQVVKRVELELDPRTEFQGRFPESLLANECSTDERRRIHHQWALLVESINELCKTRRNIMVNKHIRRTVFDSGMTNLCRGFSRRHLNLKVEFKNHNHTSYKLEIVRLSSVPDASLTSRACVAEIPQLLVEADAELVGDDQETPSETGIAEESNSSSRTNSSRQSDVIMVTAQIISSTTAEPIQAIPVEPDADATPFAFQVLRIED